MNLMVTLKLQWPLEIASTEKNQAKISRKLGDLSAVPQLLCANRL
jgi:hypothetical protein